MKIFCVQQKYLPEKKYYPPGNRNYVGRISIYPAGDGEILLGKPFLQIPIQEGQPGL